MLREPQGQALSLDIKESNPKSGVLFASFFAPQNLQEKEVTAYPAKTRKISCVFPQTSYSRKSFQKMFPKEKNKKKRKQINGKGKAETKGNGISPEG